MPLVATPARSLAYRESLCRTRSHPCAPRACAGSPSSHARLILLATGRSDSRRVAVALRMTVFADGREELLHRRLRVARGGEQQSGIPLTVGQSGENAGLLQKPRRLTQDPDRFAVAVLIFQELEGMTVLRKGAHGLLTVGQDECIEQNRRGILQGRVDFEARTLGIGHASQSSAQ